MTYERQDSNAKAKSGKEPQKLKPTLTAPKGYENTLDKEETARDKRRAMLTKEFNKVRKDFF